MKMYVLRAMRRMGSRIALGPPWRSWLSGARERLPDDVPGPVPTGGVPTNPATRRHRIRRRPRIRSRSTTRRRSTSPTSSACWTPSTPWWRRRSVSRSAPPRPVRPRCPRDHRSVPDGLWPGQAHLHRRELTEEAVVIGSFDTQLSDDPQPAVVLATDVVDATERCIIATFTADHTPRLADQSEPVVFELIALFNPKDPDRDPDGLTRRPGVITQSGDGGVAEGGTSHAHATTEGDRALPGTGCLR
jgi:hypothetical protein